MNCTSTPVSAATGATIEASCTHENDMDAIIHQVKHIRAVTVCAPVYTNTVPGSLKLIMDRFLAYHAERAIAGAGPNPAALLLTTAGRAGAENFARVQSVADAFMRNIGIRPTGEVLIDNVDRISDIRLRTGSRAAVQDLVREVPGQDQNG